MGQLSSKAAGFDNNTYLNNQAYIDPQVATQLQNNRQGIRLVECLFASQPNRFEISPVLTFVDNNIDALTDPNTQVAPLIRFWELMADHKIHIDSLEHDNLIQILSATLNQLLTTPDKTLQARLQTALSQLKKHKVEQTQTLMKSALIHHCHEDTASTRARRLQLAIDLPCKLNLKGLSTLFEGVGTLFILPSNSTDKLDEESANILNRLVTKSSASWLPTSDFICQVLPNIQLTKTSAIEAKLDTFTVNQLQQLCEMMRENNIPADNWLHKVATGLHLSKQRALLYRAATTQMRNNFAVLRQLCDGGARSTKQDTGNWRSAVKCSDESPLAFWAIQPPFTTRHTRSWTTQEWLEESANSMKAYGGYYETVRHEETDVKNYNYSQEAENLTRITTDYLEGMTALLNDDSFPTAFLQLQASEQVKLIRTILTMLPHWVLGNSPTHLEQVEKSLWQNTSLANASEQFTKLGSDYFEWLEDLRQRSLEVGFDHYLQLSMLLHERTKENNAYPLTMTEEQASRYCGKSFFDDLIARYRQYVNEGNTLHDESVDWFLRHYLEFIRNTGGEVPEWLCGELSDKFVNENLELVFATVNTDHLHAWACLPLEKQDIDSHIKRNLIIFNHSNANFEILIDAYEQHVVNEAGQVSQKTKKKFFTNYLTYLETTHPTPEVPAWFFSEIPDSVVTRNIGKLCEVINTSQLLDLAKLSAARAAISDRQFIFPETLSQEKAAWIVVATSYLAMFDNTKNVNQMLVIVNRLGQIPDETLANFFVRVKSECRSAKNPIVWKNDPTSKIYDVTLDSLHGFLNLYMQHLSQRSVAEIAELRSRPATSLTCNQFMLTMLLIHREVKLQREPASSAVSADGELEMAAAARDTDPAEGAGESKPGEEGSELPALTANYASLFTEFVKTLDDGDLPVLARG